MISMPPSLNEEKTMKKSLLRKIIALILAVSMVCEPVIAYAETSQPAVSTRGNSSKTYSDLWFQDETGWHVRNQSGVLLQATWVNDLTASDTGDNWYLIDENGRMIDSPYIRTPDGDLYALTMEHHGYFGRMISEDFELDGRTIHVNRLHDGHFGRIADPEEIRFIEGKYSILPVGIADSTTVTLVGKPAVRASGTLRQTSGKKVEPIPETGSEAEDSVPEPVREMGFEDVAPEFAIFIRPLSGKGSISEIKNIMTITDVSRLQGDSSDHFQVTFNVSRYDDDYIIYPDYKDGFGDSMHIYEAGHTYIAEIPENSGYALGAEADPVMGSGVIWAQDSIIRINFNVYAEYLFDTELDPDLTFLSADLVSGLDEDAFGGLYEAYITPDGELSTKIADTVTGTFTYDGDLPLGTALGIYKGELPFTGSTDDALISDMDDGLAYLTITGREGDVYTYRTAEMEEVLLIPDMYPIGTSDLLGDGEDPEVETASPSTARKATSSTASKTVASTPYINGEEILVRKALFTDESGTFTAREGDFIAVYDENGREEDVCYAEITNLVTEGETVRVEYEPITYDEMKERYSMHYTVPIDLEPDEEKTSEIERQITESLYANNGEILDGLVNAGIEDFISSPEYAETYGEAPLLGAGTSSRVRIKEQPVPSVYIHRDQNLSAFDNQYKGLIVSVKIIFAICIDEKYDVRLELEYEHQYAIDYNVDGSVTCEKGFLGIPKPSTIDANVSMSVDTHSFYHFHLMVRGETTQNSTFDETRLDQEEQQFIKDFNKASGVIKELAKPFGLEYVKDYITDNLGETGNMQLSQMASSYAAYMGRSNVAVWYTCPPIELFQISKRVLYQTIQIRLRGEIAVQVKLNAQLFIETNSKSAERITYTVAVRKQNSNVKEVKQLLPPELQVGVYVFGHAGVRLGLNLTVEFGLIHVKVAKVALIIQTGFYAELMGVFSYYYHEIGDDAEHVSFGFMNFEAGYYVIISALAQALNMMQLTLKKDLLDKKFPFFTLGIPTIGFAFVMDGNNVKPLELKAGQKVNLPSEYLQIKELALNTGIISVKDLSAAKECKKISADSSGIPYLSVAVFADRIEVDPYSATPGESGTLTLTYDNGYDIMNGVIGTIPTFCLTVPVKIVE